MSTDRPLQTPSTPTLNTTQAPIGIELSLSSDGQKCIATEKEEPPPQKKNNIRVSGGDVPERQRELPVHPWSMKKSSQAMALTLLQ